jgi:hypothetical protein
LEEILPVRERQIVALEVVYSVQILAEILRTRVQGEEYHKIGNLTSHKQNPASAKIVGFFVFSSLHIADIAQWQSTCVVFKRS